MHRPLFSFQGFPLGLLLISDVLELGETEGVAGLFVEFAPDTLRLR